MEEINYAPFPKLFTIQPLSSMRKTEGVSFSSVPLELLTHCSSCERVIHDKGARSPGPVGDVEKPWYCHQHQDDHLIVLSGAREVELYLPEYERSVLLRITPESIYIDRDLFYHGAALVCWRAGVFHRIESSPFLGSACFNFALYYDGFDIRHEFDIYDLDIQSGESRVIRSGYLDQTT